MRKNGFKKDLPVLPSCEFFHVYMINESGSCNFSFLKNSLVQINSKFNGKNRMITHTKRISVVELRNALRRNLDDKIFCPVENCKQTLESAMEKGLYETFKKESTTSSSNKRTTTLYRAVIDIVLQTSVRPF